MDQSLPASGHNAVIVSQPTAHAAAAPQTFTAAFTVGRSESCDVVVSHPRVSRHHLIVRPTADGWRAQCAEGRSMLVNGHAQTSAILTGTSRIRLIDEDGPLLVMTLSPAAGIPPVPGPGAVFSPGAGAPVPGAAPGPFSAPVPAPPVCAPGPVSAPGVATPGPGAVFSPGTGAPAPSLVFAPAPGGAAAPGPLTPAAPRVVEISRTGMIGRAPDNDFVLSDPLVSAHHARIEWNDDGVLITDLGSTNGTFVGNTRIHHSRLVTEPTTVGIGSTFIVVSPADSGQVQETTTAGELTIRDLTFSVDHGRLKLLDGISFALPGNELLAVVGPSGAGKSTLLKALTGEQKAQKGQVLFDGLDVYSHYAVMRNRIGVVPQNDVVHADLTVRQTLQYAAELRFVKDVSKKERTERIAEVLADLDLTEHVDKKVKKLSGGQRKRVSTAIELLTKPGLLFLDEPTSGLDPQLDRDVMNLLARLAHGTRGSDSGRTVMVVTHNETHIDRADKVLILAAGGRPVYFGPPRDVIPYFEQRLEEIRQGGRLITRAPQGGFADPTEITGFADVYTLIRNHTPEMRTHLEATVPSTRPGGSTRPSSDKPDRIPRKAASQTTPRQVSMLVRRHLRIIAADPSYLLFMLVLPIIMGLLTKAISGDYGFTVPDLDLTMLTPAEVQEKHTNQALQLLVVLITGAAFAGMSVTIRELVGERDIFLREKAVGLRPGAYLAAKTIVLALVATVQTALMMGVAFAINKPPTEALVLKSAPLELSVCCWLTAFVCGLMGLMVSAFVSSSAQVMPVLVVAIMGQIVMAGGLIDISGKVVFEQLAWLMPSRWGYAMAASTIDMNAIVTYRTDDLWKHTAHQWLIDFGCLSALALTCLLACLIGLVRRGRR